jgi:hypothetical protein
MHEKDIIQHICRKAQLPVQVFQSIDWDSHERAFTRQTR